MKLATRLDLVPWSRKVEIYLHSPICLVHQAQLYLPRPFLQDAAMKTYDFLYLSLSIPEADHGGRAVLGMNFFASSNAEVVNSNPTRGMHVCVRLYSVCAVAAL
jgi:hypothetical protein